MCKHYPGRMEPYKNDTQEGLSHYLISIVTPILNRIDLSRELMAVLDSLR